MTRKGKGCDIGYALAACSCEGARQHGRQVKERERSSSPDHHHVGDPESLREFIHIPQKTEISIGVKSGNQHTSF